MVEARVVRLGEGDDDLTRALQARRERDARSIQHHRCDEHLLVAQKLGASLSFLGERGRREPFEARRLGRGHDIPAPGCSGQRMSARRVRA